MPASIYRGRYAPSPTGRLHLGNARTALLAWLDARAAGGALVMRIEDVDHQRSRADLEARLLTDLRWLGLDWDEGPDVGGSFGPYRQSEREDHYAAALTRLETYQCSCSRRELREEAHAADGEEPVYRGTCREGPHHPERPLAIRWRTPPGVVTVDDRLCGPQVQDVAHEVGDFLLRRRDQAWAYQLAVVVDDAEMAITDVVRGADLLLSTPRQVLLQRALGWPTPRYAHVPLILGPDGAKLSKRHGAPDLSALREGGARPERVVALLARSLGLVDARVEVIAARDLIAGFELARIRPVAVDWRVLADAARS
ncbi:MAG: tRNA glutamyl-Q(34) synthetase GluQRS [Myxococcales bacterium]|nr:tRNA glutamyl-Q(34) synthetase GluQRS [Myxococcales bacterium]